MKSFKFLVLLVFLVVVTYQQYEISTGLLRAYGIPSLGELNVMIRDVDVLKIWSVRSKVQSSKLTCDQKQNYLAQLLGKIKLCIGVKMELIRTLRGKHEELNAQDQAIEQQMARLTALKNRVDDTKSQDQATRYFLSLDNFDNLFKLLDKNGTDHETANALLNANLKQALVQKQGYQFQLLNNRNEKINAEVKLAALMKLVEKQRKRITDLDTQWATINASLGAIKNMINQIKANQTRNDIILSEIQYDRESLQSEYNTNYTICRAKFAVLASDRRRKLKYDYQIKQLKKQKSNGQLPYSIQISILNYQIGDLNSTRDKLAQSIANKQMKCIDIITTSCSQIVAATGCSRMDLSGMRTYMQHNYNQFNFQGNQQAYMLVPIDITSSQWTSAFGSGALKDVSSFISVYGDSTAAAPQSQGPSSCYSGGINSYGVGVLNSINGNNVNIGGKQYQLSPCTKIECFSGQQVPRLGQNVYYRNGYQNGMNYLTNMGYIV